jgi:hypothetical protein
VLIPCNGVDPILTASWVWDSYLVPGRQGHVITLGSATGIVSFAEEILPVLLAL